MIPYPENNNLSTGRGPAGDMDGLDRRLFVLLRRQGHWPAVELPLRIFSICGNWGLFWVGIATIIWLSGGTNGRGLLTALPVFTWLTLILNYAIKTLFGRNRPVPADPQLRPLVRVPSSKSLPSSHAAMSFAAAGVLTFFYPPFFPVFYLLALLMSWSRVYVGVHYPSDVLAGTVVGLAAGGVAALILSLVY
ncbi:MAG: phosphatase PAP2 family protein [Actinobacteria bacterium]|nr:phosphatase PAP2 family protein [Actinomycetota bacterium]